MAINEDRTEDTDDALVMLSYRSTPIQGKLEGFTPLIDTIAEGPGGIVRAAVFGKIWRYCQMKDGVCRASLSTIAAGLGLDRSTVQRHAEALVADKYLKDLTPDLKHRPHVYKDTRKAGLTVNLSVAESRTDQKSVAEDRTSVAESRLSKDLKKEKDKREKPTRQPSETYTIAEALAYVCKVDLEANKGRLLKDAQALLKATPKATVELLKENYNGNPSAYWWRSDWRGQKGQTPSPANIRETWGKWVISGDSVTSDLKYV